MCYCFFLIYKSTDCKSAPSGDEVWIGPNAVIVGKVTIGNNVLIAPNAYVNTDVPANSVVIGNPAVITSKINATEGYINNKIYNSSDVADF